MTELLYGENEHEEEIITGASIDLEILHKDIGYIPHPKGVCENPAPQQEIYISLMKNLDKEKHRIRDIPGILNWVGTNIGYYDEDGDFVSGVEDNEVDPETNRFYVFWD